MLCVVLYHRLLHVQGILFHDRMEEEAMHGIEPDLAALEEAAGGDVGRQGGVSLPGRSSE